LTSLLADKYKNICVVGDDDQSIYRFRGATIENILSFENHYKGAKVIRLEENYQKRGQNVLRMVSILILVNHNILKLSLINIANVLIFRKSNKA